MSFRLEARHRRAAMEKSSYGETPTSSTWAIRTSRAHYFRRTGASAGAHPFGRCRLVPRCPQTTARTGILRFSCRSVGRPGWCGRGPCRRRRSGESPFYSFGPDPIPQCCRLYPSRPFDGGRNVPAQGQEGSVKAAEVPAFRPCAARISGPTVPGGHCGPIPVFLSHKGHDGLDRSRVAWGSVAARAGGNQIESAVMAWRLSRARRFLDL